MNPGLNVNENRAFDLVSLGEVMLRMSPPKFERLRRARSLDIQVAGAQLNVAANLARLGKKTAFLSRLPLNELGLLAHDTCLSYGVDMSYVQMIPGARMGVNYLEFTATPRVGVTIFDRQGSAASTIGPADFDWTQILRHTKLAYTDGIVPGLSDGCRAAVLEFLKTARQEGCLTCFDVNYREHIWKTPQNALHCWEALLPYVDLVVTSRSVSGEVFGWTDPADETLLRRYAERFGCRFVTLTHREIMGVLRGAWRSVGLVDGQMVEGKRFEFDVIDRYGTGDAFFAGLLYGYLETGDPGYALDFGDAACALAHTVEGDVLHVSAAEVGAILTGTIDLRVKR